MTEDAQRARALEVFEELDKMYRGRAIAEGRLHVVAVEKSYCAPSSKPETTRQKLLRANKNTTQVCLPEAPLTEAERKGLTQADFDKLRAGLRMELYNAAMYRRRLAQAGNGKS